jgi:hypothetical protein
MRRKAGRLWSVVAVVVMLGGCHAGSEDPSTEGQVPAWERLGAGEFLSVLEARLLEDGTGPLEFEVSAEGAFEAELAGILDTDGRGPVELEAEGTFGDDPVEISLDWWAARPPTERAVACVAGSRRERLIGDLTAWRWVRGE